MENPPGFVAQWEKGERLEFTPEERRALERRDYGSLYAMGAHPFLLWSFTEAIWRREMDREELVKDYKAKAAARRAIRISRRNGRSKPGAYSAFFRSQLGPCQPREPSPVAAHQFPAADGAPDPEDRLTDEVDTGRHHHPVVLDVHEGQQQNAGGEHPGADHQRDGDLFDNCHVVKRVMESNLTDRDECTVGPAPAGNPPLLQGRR